MRLNNNGWGTTELLISAAIIFILLLVVSYYVNLLYDTLDDSTSYSTSVKSVDEDVNKSYYISYENEMISAARRYVDNYNISISYNGENIYLRDLVRVGYIDYLYDSKTKKACDGYVYVRNINDNNNYTSYISCSSYVTKGY